MSDREDIRRVRKIKKVNHFSPVRVLIVMAVFALILLSSFVRLKDGKIPLTFILVALIYIGQQIFEGIFINDNISNLTHIIGGVVGAATGYALNKRKR